jgi:colanic acid biosynthesis protein WcaH
MSNPSFYLPDEQFRQVIAAILLVSIDLVWVREQQILLGKRLNRPAKDYWFVPGGGGSIRKNEFLELAFERLTLTELGKEQVCDRASLLGIFDHFYPNSVFG